MSELSAYAVVGMLSEPDRLAVFAAAALGARTPTELAERSGLGVPAAVAARQKLTTAGLLEPAGVVALGALRALARAGAPVDEHAGDPLRAFLREGRVTSFPAQPGRRRELLERVVSELDPDGRWSEPELDALLDARLDGPDHATLRRYLVVAGLLERSGGVYWRPVG